MVKIIIIFNFFIFLLFSKYALSLDNKYKLEILKSNLSSPWSFTFINNNQILISEKTGKIKLFDIQNNKITAIDHNLNFIRDKNSQGGLLDVYFYNDQIFISYSEKIGDKLFSPSTTSIAKADLDLNFLDFENIFRANPPIRSPYHFGSRIAIHDDYLYASVGERGKGMIAQDAKQHPGSIIRIKLDGTSPKDNPHYISQETWLPEIYQIGVRNPQGMSISPFDNKIYISNHGAKGGDWFGEVKKGENYGWKILGWGGTNYDNSKIGPQWLPGYMKAIHYWVPSIAVSAISIYDGKEFPEFKGLALITSLKDQSLRSLDFSNLDNVKEDIIFKKEIGRIRDIKIHPDNGKIFFLAQDKLWLFEKK